MTDSSDIWPKDLHFDTAAKTLNIAFDDGFTSQIPFELLRVESPSAEVQGHGERTEPKAEGGKRQVGVVSASPVGRYAVKIVFDDGHDTGLFTWPYLRMLALERDQRMKRYLARLETAGLSRD